MGGSAPRPVVVVTERLADEPMAWLGERCEVIAAQDPKTSEPMESLLARAEGLVVRTYTRVDAALLERAPALRVVGRAGVGLDNVDVASCAARGVRVVHRPGANTRAVVELVVAFMLDALRPRARVEGAMDEASWRALREAQVAPKQLGGSMLGIVGLGRIGSRVARAAAALEMDVIYHDVRPVEEARRFGAKPASLDEVLAGGDVVTLHVDGRASNRHLIGERELGLMRDEAVLINTSRGFVVDGAAVGRFLRAHPGAMAMLDVHDPEPIPAASPLLGMPNARLTAHIGGATRAAKVEMSWVVRDVWRVLNGEAPEFEADAAGA